MGYLLLDNHVKNGVFFGNAINNKRWLADKKSGGRNFYLKALTVSGIGNILPTIKSEDQTQICTGTTVLKWYMLKRVI